ncbi:RdgB/HAM1 family non-canonical purine NTP pyrophosphatase, partial [Moraxella sp.]|uniref:RdgB/HAM1 family non-canonical purine NTP pyrophosphatase n=1 Tax=Moraxella sp. TaxID=479 RepID=UPI00260457B5
KGKLAEFQALFDQANLGITIIPQGELGITDADEIGWSFIENAIIKARHASAASGLPALADDSGLCVPVLGNMPGINSARYAGVHGDDQANNAKLLTELAPLRGDTPIIGKFVCVLALVQHADDPLPIIAQGEWAGEILDTTRGENGFGYDPLFYVPSLDKSSAELEKAVKNSLSHRGQALKVLINQLK